MSKLPTAAGMFGMLSLCHALASERNKQRLAATAQAQSRFLQASRNRATANQALVASRQALVNAKLLLARKRAEAGL